MPRDKRPQTTEQNDAISVGVIRYREERYGPSRPTGGSKRAAGTLRCAPCVRDECHGCMTTTEIVGGPICQCGHIAIGVDEWLALRYRNTRRGTIRAEGLRAYQAETNGVFSLDPAPIAGKPRHNLRSR